jgi:hypothetical protein
MKLKSSVKFGNHLMAISFANTAVNDIFNKAGYPFVITSCNDSTHGIHSLHYSDSAFDFRSKHISSAEEKQQIVNLIKEALTADFDVLLEELGTDQEHFHLEYDPK